MLLWQYNCRYPQFKFVRWNIIQEMKSKAFNDQQNIVTHLYQVGSMPQFLPSRSSHVARDYSNDQKIRRISPLPQERFSQFSGNLVYPIPSFTPNQYQLPVRGNELSATSLDNKKNIQDLIARIQKLELRAEKTEKLEFRVEKVENSLNKFQSQMDGLENKSQQLLQGNENRMNLQNCGGKKQEQLKVKIKNLITRQQLQRQLIGLDSAFKTLIKQMKSNTSIQMRQIHTKEKKAMIEVVASQISDKLEVFKSKFILDLTQKIQKIVQEYAGSHFMSKYMIEKSQQKSYGGAVSVKICESLNFESNGVERSLKLSEMTYFIDTQGYILDSNLTYLLDKSSSKIKLSEAHMNVLRKQGLLNISKEPYKASMKESSSTDFNES